MNSLKPGFADELLKLALYDRLLALFRLSPWIILAMLLLVILFFLLNFNRLESGKRIQETDNAYTQLDRVVLEAKVSGYVAQVGFGDFQQVKAEDVLLRVQDADYRARTDQARAVRDKSAANLERLDLEIGLQEACIRQARVAAENAAARLDLASRENARVQKLFKCNAVSTREADSAEINLRTAQHSHREALAEVRVQERKLELQKADRQLREADLRAAEAQLQSALIDLGHTIITAPGNGHTGARKIQVGDLVREGMQVVSLVLDMPPYIVANYKETQIGNIRAGQPVEILIDTFPGHTFKGHVESISPATGATFSLLPKDTSSGNFTKVVQRIPARAPLAARLRVLPASFPRLPALKSCRNSTARTLPAARGCRAKAAPAGRRMPHSPGKKAPFPCREEGCGIRQDAAGLVLPLLAVVTDHFIEIAGLDLFAGSGKGSALAGTAAFIDMLGIADEAHITTGALAHFGGQTVGIHFHIGGHVFLAHLAHFLVGLGGHHRAGSTAHQALAGLVQIGFQFGLGHGGRLGRSLFRGFGGFGGCFFSRGGRSRAGAFVPAEQGAAAAQQTGQQADCQDFFHLSSLLNGKPGVSAGFHSKGEKGASFSRRRSPYDGSCSGLLRCRCCT